MDTLEKIVSRQGLTAILEEHRRASHKIVFANGVFDLLHVGHVRYLEAARAEADLLVVGNVGLDTGAAIIGRVFSIPGAVATRAKIDVLIAHTAG